jgi:hypothetical protein
MSEEDAREVHRANLCTLMLGDPAAAADLAVHLQVDNVRRTRFKSGDIPSSDVLLRALRPSAPRSRRCGVSAMPS